MEKLKVGVQVDLEGKALDLINQEQKKNPRIGKARYINILLTELYERRIFDTIVEPTPLSNKNWKKFLKK